MLINLRNALMAGKRWKNPYVTNGLILQWDGEWNAGGGVHDVNFNTTVRDISANGNNLAISSPATVNVDAVVFDGTQSPLCSTAFSVANWLTNDGTVEFVGSFSTIADAAMFDIGSAEFSSRGLRLTPYASSFYAEIVATCEYRLNTYRLTRLGGAYTPGTRVSVCCVTNSTNSTVDVYINGVYVSTVTGGNATNFVNKISIGWGIPAGTATNARPMELCGFRMYSRAITAQEIAANYAVDAQRFGLT